MEKNVGGSTNGRYGWGPITPNILQYFASSKWALAFCCPGPFIQGVIINGLLHFFIPSLERQFELSSTQSGLISSGYDMAATICLLPLATYGGRDGAHKPRFIGIGLVVLGTGAIIFSSPAFLAGPYTNGGVSYACNSTEMERKEEFPKQRGKNQFGWVLFFGNLLHGAGATPLFSLAITFIDDSFPIHSASFYIGIYYTMAVLGPLVGITIGGALSQLSVNFMINPSYGYMHIFPENPTFVGCWWLGFLVAGVLSYISSVPLFGLPKELPGMKHNKEVRDLLETNKSNRLEFNNIQELPKGILRLLKNFRYLFLTLAASCEGVIFSGMAAFMTKLLLQQFGLGPKQQAIYKAALAIPSSLIGMIGGGWVIKYFSMNLRQILKMVVCLMSCSFPCIAAILIYCSTDDLVGLTRDSSGEEKFTLKTECNSNCGCDESYFFPVCGLDNKTYYSGCYAGCLRKHNKKGVQTFDECQCIMKVGMKEDDATEGFCTTDCRTFILFILGFFIYQTLSFFCVIPTLTSSLRVVHSELRSLAVALQWVIGRILGTIPGPLLFGQVIDRSCRYWQTNEDGTTGNCVHYDHSTLARNLALLISTSKVLQIIFFSIALRLAVKKHERMRPNENASVRGSTVW